MLRVLTFRTPDEAVAKANNTTYGLSAGIWTEKGSRILKIANQLRAGVVWANTFNKFDPTSPFGGYKQSGYGREGGRHGLTGLPEGSDALVRRPARRPQDLQALRQRRLPALGVRPHLRGDRRQGPLPRQRRLGVPQGRPGRRRRRARRLRPKWSGATAYNRGQVLYRVAEMMEGRHAQFVRRSRAAEGLSAAKAAAAVDAAIDRWVWYAGWTDKLAAVLGRGQPRRRAVLRLLDARADRRRRRPGAAGVVAARAGQRLAPVARRRQHCVVSPRRSARCPRSRLGEVLATVDVPGGVVNVLTGRRRRSRPGWPSTRRSTRSTWPAPRRCRALPLRSTGVRSSPPPRRR